MGDYTARFSELHYPLLIENPDAVVAGTYNSVWISMEAYHRGVLLINCGDMTAGDRLDVWMQQATTVGGAGGKAIANKTITLTQAIDGGNDLVCMELQTEEMDVSNHFDFIRVVYRVLGTSTELSLIYFGIEPRYPPTPTANWHTIVP